MGNERSASLPAHFRSPSVPHARPPPGHVLPSQALSTLLRIRPPALGPPAATPRCPAGTSLGCSVTFLFTRLLRVVF